MNFSVFGFFSDLELKPVGVLEVKLVQAKELTNKDIIGKSDPFAVVYIRPLRDKMKTSKTIVRCTFSSRISNIILINLNNFSVLFPPEQSVESSVE